MTYAPTSISARLHPFLRVLSDAGVPYMEAAERAKIPAAVLERTDVRYSLPSAYKFLSRIEREHGIDDLAFRGAAKDDLPNIEPHIRKHFMTACTLLVCLQRYVSLVRRYNGRPARVKTGPDTSWVIMPADRRVAHEAWNRFSDWSNLLVPISICRYFLGPFWCPGTIALQSPSRISDVARAVLPNSGFLTGARITGFTIPTRMLSWHIPLQENRQQRNRPFLVDDIMPELSLSRTVAELLGPYLGESGLSIEQAAEICCMSTRSMQRRLAEEGTGFREIVNGQRYELAVDMLSDPDNRIIDIALELGYDDPSHFSRAFRTLAGVSPSSYRQSVA